jgi:hypothetical protein
MGKPFDGYMVRSPEEKRQVASEYRRSPNVRIIHYFVENCSEHLHLLSPYDRKMVLLAYFYSSIFLREKEKIAAFVRDPKQLVVRSVINI